jgi:hypothetical protein
MFHCNIFALCLHLYDLEYKNVLLFIQQVSYTAKQLASLRVLGYRSGGPGSIPDTTRQKKVVGLERGPLSLVSTTEGLLNRKVAAPI